jgi:protein-disulfide isomerase
MSNAPRESQRSLKEKAAAARAAAEAEQRRRDNRIRLIGGAAILAAVALIIGIGIWGSKQGDSSTSGAVVADAKVPSGVNAGGGDNAWGVPFNQAAGMPTLAIWEDFQCPSCAQLEATSGDQIIQLAEAGKVNLIWRVATFLDPRFASTSPNPNSSQRAAAAWGCAIDGAKTAEFHKTVFENQPATEGDGWSDAELLEFGKQAGLTGAAYTTFETCVTDKVYQQWAVNSQAAFTAAAVPGTPTAYLNGTEVPAAALRDMTALEKLITEATGK